MSIVRTAYAFSPTSITGCVLWMDAADSSTITLSSTAITQWNDKSASANHFVQATTANSPTVGTSANGLPTVYFATDNKQLVSSQNNATTGNASRTVIQVFWCPTLSSAYYSVTGTESGANPAQAWGHAKNANSDVTYPFMYSSAGNDVYTFVYSTPNPLITYAQYDSTASSLNAYYATSGATGGTTTVGNFTTKSCTFNTTAGVWYLGRRQQAATGSITSHLLEMIHFNKVLSTTERQQVEGYLAQKWGLTSSLSTGHPGLTSRIYRSDYLVPNKVKPVPYYTQFSPRQIPGCALWLDAADSSTITGTTTVTAWTDKSGNGNHAAFDTNKPSYTAANRYIETTNNNTHIRLPSAAFTNTTNQTCIIFIIYADKQTGSNNQALFSTLDYGLYQLLRCPTYAGAYLIRGNMTSDASYTAFKNSLMTTNIVLYSLQYTAGVTGADNYSVAPFGNYWHPISANTQSITSDIYLGGIASFDIAGDVHANLQIYEIIAYNNVVLTSAQRQQVESYLAQKWGLTASLPGGHSHLTQQAGAVTTVAKTKFKVTGLPRYVFASTGLAITHQDGRVWKVSSTAIGLNTGTAMSLTIYAGSDVFNSAGGRVALFDGGSSANAVRHSGYNMYANTFSANNYDFGWKFVSSGSGYLIYNDYPSYSSWQVSYDSGTDRVLIVAPGDGRYGLVWNVTPKVTLAYVYSSY